VYVDRERENLVSMSTKTSLCFFYFFVEWLYFLFVLLTNRFVIWPGLFSSAIPETPTCKCVVCTLNNRSFRLLLAHGTHTGQVVFIYFSYCTSGRYYKPPWWGGTAAILFVTFTIFFSHPRRYSYSLVSLSHLTPT